MKEDEMGGSCVTRGAKLKERDHLEDLPIDGK
jgi:hypothetical protein